MNEAEAIRIIKSLADGVDPLTGEAFPSDSPYQRAETVRALFLALDALNQGGKSGGREKRLLSNAGMPWSDQEDEDLTIRFEDGVSIAEISRIHRRTIGAIRSRLVKLGKIPAG
jgi:hypothetical protein